MKHENHDRSQNVVEKFRIGLSEDAQSEVGENNFEKLTLLINEALQEDRKEAADKIEEVLKSLRKDIDIPELGM